MSKRLFVGNLAYAVRDESLKAAFAKFGAISEAKVVTEGFSGRSKGFGFVEFENDADADRAIAELNNTDLEGRKIIVNEARPREDRRA